MAQRTDSPSGPRDDAEGPSKGLALYLLIGIYFGVVLTKSEVISWFRIQEMFRFDAFHMYGIIGSAVAVAALSLWAIRHFDVRTVWGEEIAAPPPKKTGRVNTRYWLGGALFGMGWALTGACPGPLAALLGNGVWVMGVAILSALAGTWVYGQLRPHLPHY